MPTNLAIDDKLLEDAKRLDGHRTKRETVNVALREYVRRRKQLKALQAFGTIDFNSNGDYRADRRKR
jgi:Arc/MetJ family transcription regulator